MKGIINTALRFLNVFPVFYWVLFVLVTGQLNENSSNLLLWMTLPITVSSLALVFLYYYAGRLKQRFHQSFFLVGLIVAGGLA